MWLPQRKLTRSVQFSPEIFFEIWERVAAAPAKLNFELTTIRALNACGSLRETLRGFAAVQAERHRRRAMLAAPHPALILDERMPDCRLDVQAGAFQIL